MHDASIARAHRIEGDHPAGQLRLLCQPSRQLLQCLPPPLPVAFDVDDDPVSLALAVAADRAVDEVFERVERLATPADDEAGFLAAHREENRSRLGGLMDGDGARDTEVAEDLLDECPSSRRAARRRYRCLVGRGGECFPRNIVLEGADARPQRCPDARSAATEAPQAAGGIRQYLDLDPVPLHLKGSEGLRDGLVDALAFALDRSHATPLLRLPTAGSSTAARW